MGIIFELRSPTSHIINEDIFPEPRVFRPERWHVDEMGLARLAILLHSETGACNCVSMILGVAELYLLLAAEAGHFEMNLFQTDRVRR